MRGSNISVNIINEQKRMGISSKKMREFVRLVLRLCRVRNAQLNILITDAEQMRALNRRYLKKAAPTDVLAFDERSPDDGVLSADIAISTDAAIKRCKEFETSAQGELKLYLVHAILHLLGYNDKSREEKSLMQEEEKGLLGKLCGMEIS